MTFQDALDQLMIGVRITRQGWNGKGMWLQRVDEGSFTDGDRSVRNLEPFIVMKTVQDKYIPWLASQSDMLAEDWDVVPYES
jgi:hypothetical protein